MRPLLAYGDVIANNYITSPAGVVISPENQSLIVAALNVLNNDFVWEDYEDFQDEIEALLADTQHAVMTTEIPPPVNTMLNIDLFCVNGSPLAGAGTLTYNASATLPFGYSMSNQNITLYGIENDVWLRAGDYDYVGWASLTTSGGNVGVALTDGSSVIDTIISSISQNGAFGTRVKHTGTFTVPDDGFYKIVAADLGTAGGHVCNWISHHIRQTS